jgi:hypothetical protein
VCFAAKLNASSCFALIPSLSFPLVELMRKRERHTQETAQIELESSSECEADRVVTSSAPTQSSPSPAAPPRGERAIDAYTKYLRWVDPQNFYICTLCHPLTIDDTKKHCGKLLGVFSDIKNVSTIARHFESLHRPDSLGNPRRPVSAHPKILPFFNPKLQDEGMAAIVKAVCVNDLSFLIVEEPFFRDVLIPSLRAVTRKQLRDEVMALSSKIRSQVVANLREDQRLFASMAGRSAARLTSTSPSRRKRKPISSVQFAQLG